MNRTVFSSVAAAAIILIAASCDGGRVGSDDENDISGAFPLLVTPYTADACLDTTVLVREALFVEKEGASGIIWPTAVELEILDSLGEYRMGLEALARKWSEEGRGACLTAVCCGRDQESSLRRIELWNEIAGRYGIRAAILGRLPDNIMSEEEMEAYFRAVAEVDRLPFIMQTHNGRSPQPSVSLMVRMAQEYPDIYGYIKEESGDMALTDDRMAELQAAGPVIKTIFSGYGAIGFLFQGPEYGARGVITQKPDCTRLLAEMCERAQAGAGPDDAGFADAFGKMLIMANLNIHFRSKETFRQAHLVILKELGVFDNTYSRKKSPDGGFEVESFEVTDTQMDFLRSLIRLIYE